MVVLNLKSYPYYNTRTFIKHIQSKLIYWPNRELSLSLASSEFKVLNFEEQLFLNKLYMFDFLLYMYIRVLVVYRFFILNVFC